MAQLSYADYLQQQKQNQERQAARAQGVNQGPGIGFFKLSDNGDEAIVRFTFNSPNDLPIFTTHAITVDGKFRKVNCLRSFRDPMEACPLCHAGKPYKQSVYITLIEYTKNDDGTISAVPKVWERATGFMQTLASLYSEYGDLSSGVYKIRRNGAKGSMQTTYTVIPANPAVYNEQNYLKDFSAFENFKVLGGPLMDKTYDELVDLAKEQVQAESVNTTYTRPEPQTYTTGAVHQESAQTYQTAYATPPSGGQRRIEY